MALTTDRDQATTSEPGSNSRVKPESRIPISARVACGLLVPVDALAILAASFLAYTIWLYDFTQFIWADYVFATLFATLLAINVFNLAGLYDMQVASKIDVTLRRLVVSFAAVAALLVLVSFLTKTSADYSRAWSVLWFTLGLLLLVAGRCVFFLKARQWRASGRFYRNIAIVGSCADSYRLLDHLATEAAPGTRIVGLYDDRVNPRRDGGNYAPVDGGIDTLIQYARGNPLDTIIVVLPLSAEHRINEILERLKMLPVDIRLFPGAMAFQLQDDTSDDMGRLPVIKVLDRPLSDWRLALKGVEDRVLASAILMLITPVLLAIAAAIKLSSPGPVLFRQMRYGYNDQLFEVLKFRTMHADQADRDGNQLTRRCDPRITRVGAFLRRTSLDELPQFINVLRGDMSIVGPRPHAVAAKADGLLYPDAVRNYPARHRVKPGITGWAQINGWRGETEQLYQIQNRVEHDLRYIENWSLWLDMKIIFLTILRGFSSRHAF